MGEGRPRRARAPASYADPGARASPAPRPSPSRGPGARPCLRQRAAGRAGCAEQLAHSRAALAPSPARSVARARSLARSLFIFFLPSLPASLLSLPLELPAARGSVALSLSLQ